jgi:hypothetical protein
VAASPSVIISAASTTVPESPSPEIVGARVIKRRTRVAARKRHVIASFARLCVRFAFLKVGVIEVEAEAYGHYSKKKKLKQRLEKMTKSKINEGRFAKQTQIFSKFITSIAQYISVYCKSAN